MNYSFEDMCFSDNHSSPTEAEDVGEASVHKLAQEYLNAPRGEAPLRDAGERPAVLPSLGDRHIDNMVKTYENILPSMELVDFDLGSAILQVYRAEGRSLSPGDRAKLTTERAIAEGLGDSLMTGDLEQFKKTWEQAKKQLTPDQLEHMIENINNAIGPHLNLSLDLGEDGSLHIFNRNSDNQDVIKIMSDGKVDIVALVTRSDNARCFQPVDKVGETKREKAREFQEIISRAKSEVGGQGGGFDPFKDWQSKPLLVPPPGGDRPSITLPRIHSDEPRINWQDLEDALRKPRPERPYPPLRPYYEGDKVGRRK